MTSTSISPPLEAIHRSSNMANPLEKSTSPVTKSLERLETEMETAQNIQTLEKRVKRKIDFGILPLLSSVLFLAQMVNILLRIDRDSLLMVT